MEGVMHYGVDEKLPFLTTLLYGLQWFVVTLPSAVITGVIVTQMHNYSLMEQHAYLQILLIAVGVTTVAQVLWGHRLPLTLGPAATLLIGVTASLSHSTAQIYTAIAIGGGVVSLLAVSGLLRKVYAIFTPRVIIVILLLVALNLIPVIVSLILSDGGGLGNVVFALLFVLGVVVINTFLQGIWKATTLIWGILLGTVVYLTWVDIPDRKSVV